MRRIRRRGDATTRTRRRARSSRSSPRHTACAPVSEHVDTIRTFKTSLYDEEAATEARMQLIAGITLPTDPPLCAASIGLLALLEPRARQLQMLHIHPGFA